MMNAYINFGYSINCKLIDFSNLKFVIFSTRFTIHPMRHINLHNVKFFPDFPRLQLLEVSLLIYPQSFASRIKTSRLKKIETNLCINQCLSINLYLSVINESQIQNYKFVLTMKTLHSIIRILRIEFVRRFSNK